MTLLADLGIVCFFRGHVRGRSWTKRGDGDKRYRRYECGRCGIMTLEWNEWVRWEPEGERKRK